MTPASPPVESCSSWLRVTRSSHTSKLRDAPKSACGDRSRALGFRGRCRPGAVRRPCDRRHRDRRRGDRTRIVHAARRWRRCLRVHACLRLGRRRPRRGDRSCARGSPRRGGNHSQAPVAVGARPAVRRPRRGAPGKGAGRSPTQVDTVRARARQLAPVLPDPGRIARHRRHRDHRWYVTSGGARRRAPSDDRRQRLGR